jgi:hypothetical protein
MAQNVLLIQGDPSQAGAVRDALINSSDGSFDIEWVTCCSERPLPVPVRPNAPTRSAKSPARRETATRESSQDDWLTENDIDLDYRRPVPRLVPAGCWHTRIKT